jgi:hypothetical protein
MSRLKLNGPIGANYQVDTNDLQNTKRALNQLGYYSVPPERGIDDWADTATFDGIRQLQRDNGLKVDGFMRPKGPTETTINQNLSRQQGPINAGALLDQFDFTMGPGFYDGGTGGYAESTKCCATGTAACED